MELKGVFLPAVLPDERIDSSQDVRFRLALDLDDGRPVVIDLGLAIAQLGR